jgi:hypothetical protein
MVKEVDLSQVYIEAAYHDHTLQLASEIVTRNQSGNVWLIGGSVFRRIVSALYGTPMAIGTDYDFIVENPITPQLPSEWKTELNHYGNTKLIGPSIDGASQIKIDYIPITNISSIIRRGLSPTVENLLTGTPLTIQSIAYHLNSQTVVGDIGMASIRSRLVAVNDVQEATDYASKKNLSLTDLVTRMSSSLGFTAQSP